MKKNKIFGCFCLLTGLLSLYYGVIQYSPYYENIRAMDGLRGQVMNIDSHGVKNRESFKGSVHESPDDDMTNEKATNNVRIDFTSLRRINTDITGWIYIPGTCINYPVLQGDFIEEYLNKGYDGRENSLGSIFTYPEVNIKCDRHSILFGHRTFDCQMFGDLELFDDPEFGRTHRVFLYTEDFCREYEVIASYLCMASDDSFNTEYDGETYIQLIASNARGNGWMAEVDAGDINTILTLVTCPSENSENYRRVVQCINRN